MIEIKNRFTNRVIMTIEAETLSDADLSYADLSYANLSGADLSGADLSYADLSYADLSGADLSYADLSYADLSGADLSGVNLSGANLSGADLSGANLSGAKLPESPIVENLPNQILNEIEKNPEALDMGCWHTCETTHCMAGWAVHLAGEAGYALEKKLSYSAAGALIFANSGYPVPDFHCTEDEAVQALREMAGVA